MITKKNLLKSGKVKSLYETDQENLLIAEFRDDTTAFDGEKHEKLADKGLVNNQINAFVMKLLEQEGVPTHFEKLLSPNECLVKRLDMIPLESVVRNYAAGSLCKRYGIEQGKHLETPLQEFFLKDDALHDPMICENHAISFGWATQDQLNQMRVMSLQINEILKAAFAKAGMILVDAKYEFGVADGKMYVGDEISPDSCRIWDEKTHESLDKDRFRKDLGKVIESYKEIAERIGAS